MFISYQISFLAVVLISLSPTVLAIDDGDLYKVGLIAGCTVAALVVLFVILLVIWCCLVKPALDATKGLPTVEPVYRITPKSAQTTHTTTKTVTIVRPGSSV